ncbi:MAG TPA: transposase [Chloroflexia bacterium]|nr:transposase [Chloroflexia bacterium]
MHLPHLARPQVAVLAAWSWALVVTQSCGRTTVGAFLARVWGQSEATVRQQLREWTYEAPAKKGAKRVALEVRACLAPLLRWVLTYWPACDAHLAVALDATLLRDRWAVLACSVVYRGCAIPVAWKIVPANTKGAWKPHWLDLLEELAAVVPEGWTVLVLADRALYARWLFARIVANGWHPFLRIQRQGYVRRAGQAHWHELRTLVPEAGTAWAGAVTCFKNPEGQLNCTLLAHGEAGYRDPWFIVTDLPQEVAACAWYGLRTWIEAGFKDLKRGGWHWEQTKLRDPGRWERQWLVLAVATLWVVSVGGEAEATAPVSGLEALPALHIARRVRRGGSQARLLSCFRRGVVVILAGLLRGVLVDMGTFWPEPWPAAEARPALRRVEWPDSGALAA